MDSKKNTPAQRMPVSRDAAGGRQGAEMLQRGHKLLAPVKVQIEYIKSCVWIRHRKALTALFSIICTGTLASYAPRSLLHAHFKCTNFLADNRATVGLPALLSHQMITATDNPSLWQMV